MKFGLLLELWNDKMKNFKNLCCIFSFTFELTFKMLIVRRYWWSPIDSPQLTINYWWSSTTGFGLWKVDGTNRDDVGAYGPLLLVNSWQSTVDRQLLMIKHWQSWTINYWIIFDKKVERYFKKILSNFSKFCILKNHHRWNLDFGRN